MMFAFHYNFAAGPPSWKDLPCFIQKALRNFVTESEVVYDRNFFLKKFGIIIKNPIIPYRTQEFNDHLKIISICNLNPKSLRHFTRSSRVIIKKYLPLYRSLRTKIEETLLKIVKPAVRPLVEKVPPSDQRIVALTHLIGPVFMKSSAYFRKDLPPVMSYYSQMILSFDRSLQSASWPISKSDRHVFSLRLIKLWSEGVVPFPKELESFVTISKQTRLILEPLFKLKFQGKVDHHVIDLPNLGIVENARGKKYYDAYKNFSFLRRPTKIINVNAVQIKENVIIRKQLSTKIQEDDSYSVFISRLPALKTRAPKNDQNYLKNTIDVICGLKPQNPSYCETSQEEKDFFSLLEEDPNNLLKYESLLRIIGQK